MARNRQQTTREARYKLLADNATDMIALYGIDGKFTYVSPAVQAVLEYRPEELIGRASFEFTHPDDGLSVQQAFRALIKAGPDEPPPRVRYRGITRSGKIVWLEAHPRAIRNDLGRVIEFQDSVRDVTATKALEDALTDAKNAADASGRSKSEFLANMSHELRTPPTSILGFSNLLQACDDLKDVERRYADRIATSSQALLSVINDILDFSKIEAGAIALDERPFNPLELARSALSIVELQCQAKGLKLTLEVDRDLPAVVNGDEGRLRQVMLNFLSNAVKFTSSGEVRLDLGWSGDTMRVSVTDSGIGIPADKIDALFERFTQADASTTRVYGGTGLGLAISMRLIECMGGEIGVTSQPGKGSSFWFEVPLSVTEMTEAEKEVVSEGLRPGVRILLADDTAANRELVRIIVEQWGVELVTAEDGAEAVRAAASGDYDLILMDVHMPRMDGLDATRAIRAMEGRAAKTPILALTANVQPEQVEACRQAGMSGHVGKPIQVKDLMAAICRATTLPN